MRYLVNTKQRPCTLKVTVSVQKMCIIWLHVYDAEQPNTFLTKRYKPFSAGETAAFYVQMPICGKKTIVEVFENIVGDSGNFAMKVDAPYSLPRQMQVVDLKDKKLKDFIRFAEGFCWYAGVLPAQSHLHYQSPAGQFQILYSPLITDNRLTPARINQYTGVMECSKEKYIPATVPMRFLWLCHEYSHLHENEDRYDELEADLNGLIIYLGLGYPRIEAHETFLKAFEEVQNAETEKRYEHIKLFIDNFEKLNYENSFTAKLL